MGSEPGAGVATSSPETSAPPSKRAVWAWNGCRSGSGSGAVGQLSDLKRLTLAVGLADHIDDGTNGLYRSRLGPVRDSEFVPPRESGMKIHM